VNNNLANGHITNDNHANSTFNMEASNIHLFSNYSIGESENLQMSRILNSSKQILPVNEASLGSGNSDAESSSATKTNNLRQSLETTSRVLRSVHSSRIGKPKPKQRHITRNTTEAISDLGEQIHTASILPLARATRKSERLALQNADRESN
jgi:hypothetical protein